MRKEQDSMGEMLVPDDALYGASTQRAVLNFQVSGLRLQSNFISALGLIKLAAAKANVKLEFLPEEWEEGLSAAAREVYEGKHNDQFVVDVFQTGSGTSTNMNANEVIAKRATQLISTDDLAGCRIHPNDHVNLCQSSNDVFPTALHIAAVLACTKDLIPALQKMEKVLDKKASEFMNIIKAGRTHLQDATPVTLGQEFSGYAAQVKQSITRIERALEDMRELPLGGTAVGTGINAHPDFAKEAIEFINSEVNEKFFEAENHFAAQSAKDAVAELSATLKTTALALLKIANDIRWLGAGPRCSLGEISLPALQPGSSIMPGKVNPVMSEAVMMVASQVIGYDSAITVACQHSNFELNTMMPVMAYDLLESIRLLSNVSDSFTEKCLRGITANEERCKHFAESSLSNCTAIAPIIGYDKAAKVAKKALTENISVREAALEYLSKEELDAALDPQKMTGLD